MKRIDFLSEVKEIFLIEEDLNENTGIEVDSMAALLLIAFLDENFDKKINDKGIKKIKSVQDIIDIIGKENII